MWMMLGMFAGRLNAEAYSHISDTRGRVKYLLLKHTQSF